jgi:hypothetical protein
LPEEGCGKLSGTKLIKARVAQLVEQLICNQLVGGSSPFSGSKQFKVSGLMFKVKEPETSNFKPATVPGRFQSGQMGWTVNPLSFDFRGSNPLLPTSITVA